uniref:LRRNT domain-containing protein n=1 Tax=Photinus pyralis TaxID=7054 RepID=A0A1Y1MES8_PHOPY
MRLIIKCAWSIGLIFQLVNGEEFDCPQNCTCNSHELSTTCHHNGLVDLPNGIHLRVSRLDLSFNEFTSIPLTISTYKELHHLNMSHNKLLYIEEKSFQTLNGLEVLDLSHNLFKYWLDINKAALINLPSLYNLNLSHNPLQGFSDIFLHQPLRSNSLQTLLLINCSITNISDDLLLGFPNLKTLMLSNNPLLALTARLKSDTLQHLDLSNCNLQRMHPDGISSLTSLEYLSLAENYGLKKYSSRSKSLKHLDLSHCNLETVPSVSLPNLTGLILKGNHLRHIPANTFLNCPGLKNVDLSSNTIKKIDVFAFKPLKHVHNVDLSLNTIRDIPSATFNSNKQLTKLDLSRNYLDTVVQLSSDSLKWLDLSVCEIQHIDSQSLVLLPKLQTLNLSRNLIASIPDKLSAKSLRVLDLSRCGIFSLNILTLSALPSLRSVNLSGNRLTSGLKPSFFHRVSELNLEDNSWICDCKSQEFLEFYRWLQYSVTSSNSLRCRSPENVAGYTWENACNQIWRPGENGNVKGTWMYVWAIIALSTVLCCLAIGIRNVRRRRRTARDQEVREAERQEEQERLRQIHERNLHYSTEYVDRNAPDPRELQSPPSYVEAMSMPRPILSVSCSNLRGSQHSLRSIQSYHNENSRKTKVRRKRRRNNRQGSRSNISETQSVASISHGNTEVSNSEEELHPTLTIESNI